MTSIPEDTQKLLKMLQRAVDKTIEKKRRLGHYYVVWQDGKAVAIGDDAPPEDTNQSPQ